MHRRVAIAILTSALLGCAVPPDGPGTDAGFDRNALLTIEAPIEQLSYEQPRVEIVLRAEDRDWRCLLAAPSSLASRGLTPDLLAPGSTAIVVGRPSVRDPMVLEADLITVAGQTFEMH